MQKDRTAVNDFFNGEGDRLTRVSDKIWSFGETRFEEFKSSRILIDLLKKEGFRIETDAAGLPTGFTASYGEGTPVIALLGEYDALSGLSQKSGVSRKEPVEAGGSGHGCGHHLLGTAAAAAAIAVKRSMEELDLEGTVRFYGCPAEEGGSGKTYMVRSGLFDDVDAALTWHPLDYNGILSIRSLANYQVSFRFHGQSSHAAASPHLGRSALDAVELMNVGVNYLREHIIPEARIHYAVLNTGGISPNVVQPEGEVLYMIRAPRVSLVEEIYQRVCNVARGAALMTDTQVEIVFDKACSDCLPNRTLEESLYRNFLKAGVPPYSEADKSVAREIQTTFSLMEKNNSLDMVSQVLGGEESDQLKTLAEREFCDLLIPYKGKSFPLPGSTDVGDVSWVVPTAQIGTACFAFGTPNHSWQMVSQGMSGAAHKGMLTAGKVMAMTALDLMENTELLKCAADDLENLKKGQEYICPIPGEIKPPIRSEIV